MVYHVTCPISGRTFSYATIDRARRLAYIAINRIVSDSPQPIEIKDGRRTVGKVVRNGKRTTYRTVKGKEHGLSKSGKLIG